nr:DEAD/DEAH box helicase [Deinococcus aestuarii]
MPKGLFEQLQALLEERDDALALVEVVSDGGKRRQADCVILSPGGVDVIEVKDKRNPVIGSASGTWKTDDGGVLNAFSNPKGGRKENPYQQANRIAKDVHTWLGGRRGVRAHRLKVYPLVLIPAAHPECRIGPDNWVNLALGNAQLLGALRALRSDERVWEPGDYLGLPEELGLTPIDVAEITGKTVDRTTGTALQRVQVEATGLKRPLQVDTRGNFSFTVRPGTRLTLRLLPSTLHAPQERVLEVEAETRLIELGELYFDPVVSSRGVAQAEREVLQLQDRMEQMRADHAREVQRLVEQAEQARRQAEEEVRRVQRRQHQEARDLERLRAQGAADLQRVRQLEARVTEADAQLAALSLNRPEDQARIAELQAERQDQLGRMEALQQAAARGEQQTREAEERAAATMRDLARLQSELPGHLERLRALEAERDQQQAELGALRAEHTRVQQELAEAAARQAGQEVFARQVQAARRRLESWKTRAQQAQRALEAAQQAQADLLERERESARQARQQQEAQFQRREADLQEQLEGVLARLEALSAASAAPAGGVMARAVAWRQRDRAGARSPLARIAVDKLRGGQIPPGASLPERPAAEPDPAAWNLEPGALVTRMEGLLERWGQQLPLLPAADQPLRRSMQKRIRDALEELQEALGDGDPGETLAEARRVMASLVPEGPGNAAPAAALPRDVVLLTSDQGLSADARPWVLHGGVLRDLETGEDMDLTVPGLEEGRLPAELDGLVGLREGPAFVPVWALPPERQVEAWLPDSWSASLVDALAGGPEALADRAARLSKAQFRVVCRSLPLETLLDWTGRTWPPELPGALHDAVLARFAQDLQARGVSPRPVPVRAEQVQRALHLGDLEAVPAPEHAGARDGVSVPLGSLDLDPRVVAGLDPRAREGGLYLHQALSLGLIRGARAGGYDVVLSTPTASGKTLAFLPGVLEGVLHQGGNALFLYPLRALSADQLQTLEGVRRRMGDDAPSLGRHYGGEDVDPTDGVPRLLVATPDKLNHALDRPWVHAFAAGLRYVVLDEAHTYRGPFGAHMSGFLRRLLALCPVPPTLILSSATLQNTVAFARLLTGRDTFRVAGASTAPRYPRHLYVAQPRAGRTHRSHLGALRGFGDVIRQRQGKGLIFAGSRAASREIARELRHEADHRAAPTAFAFYSGMQNYHAELERLRDQDARPLIAASTSTLEAGIDIGDLDMVAVVGFPRSRNSFKQMVGRAGRAGTGHLAFLPGDSPADFYYARPDTLRHLLARDSEPVYLHPHNPILVSGHVERARYEAECAGRDSGPALLHTLFPEGLHPEDQEALRPVFDLPVHRVRAPLLRGDGTEPHVVVAVGGAGQPRPDELNLTATEEADWLLERLSPEAAYREWPREGRAARGDRFYRVLSWRRGTLRDEPGAFAQPVVIIAVRDVTENTLAPEEVLACRVRSPEERALPPGRYAPRTRTAKIRLGALPTRLDEAVACGPLSLEVGVGEVRLADGGAECAEQVAQALCESTGRRFRSPRMRRREPVAVEVLDRERVRQHAWQVGSLVPWTARLPWAASCRPDDPLWTAYTLPERMTTTLPDLLAQAPGRDRPRHLPDLDPRRPVPVLQVSLHEHELQVAGPCSCGGSTTLRPFWEEHWTPVSEQLPALPEDPRRWEAHDLERHTFATDMARLTLRGGDGASHRALMLALVKAIPDLLEVDPQEFGVGVVACPEVGDLELLVWDVTPGGTGITRALEDALPALIEAARALLGRARACTCEGEGCFGCILPLERVANLMVAPPGDLDEARRIDGLVFSRFAADLDLAGALRLGGGGS